MSHFTTIETQVRDVAALKAACEEMSLAVEEIAIAAGMAVTPSRAIW